MTTNHTTETMPDRVCALCGDEAPPAKVLADDQVAICRRCVNVGVRARLNQSILDEPANNVDPGQGRPMTHDERTFSYHLKDIFSQLHAAVMLLGTSRERSLAITHLEDASMRATRAILTTGSPIVTQSVTPPADLPPAPLEP